LSPAPLAYSVSDPRLPWKRLQFYRWEKAGLIPPLIRNGGKTLVRAETVEAIITGKIALPPHPARKHRPEPKGRARKAAP